MKKSILVLFSVVTFQAAHAVPLLITPEAVIKKADCLKSAVHTSGGAGTMCLNGLVTSLVVAQGKAMFESSSPKSADEALVKAKGIFPAAEFTRGENSFMFEIK